MNCHQIRQLVSAYLDQELTGQQMLEISTHLQFCSECSREWQEISDIRRLLRDLSSPSLPSCAYEKLTARLQDEEHQSFPLLSALVLSVLPVSRRGYLTHCTQAQGRSRTRLTVYAFALSAFSLLAVAAPFAPPGGDAGGVIKMPRLTTPAPAGPMAQMAVQNSVIPSLRYTAGAAGSMEVDPLRDETINSYVQDDVTMVNFQTSGAGAR